MIPIIMITNMMLFAMLPLLHQMLQLAIFECGLWTRKTTYSKVEAGASSPNGSTAICVLHTIYSVTMYVPRIFDSLLSAAARPVHCLLFERTQFPHRARCLHRWELWLPMDCVPCLADLLSSQMNQGRPPSLDNNMYTSQAASALSSLVKLSVLGMPVGQLGDQERPAAG